MRLKKVSSQEKNIRISDNIFDAVEFLKNGKIVISPTDTILGILGDALNKSVVEKVYKIKNRTPTKPYIILIPDISYLNIFGITPTKNEKKLLEHKGITVIFDLPEEKLKELEYLHRGTDSLAFRIPNDENIISMLKTLGKPIIAPSANPEGKEPAKSIEEAIKYFGDKIDLYVKGHIKSNSSSTIIKLDANNIKILRNGNTTLEEIENILRGEINEIT